MSALELRGVRKAFGSTVALDGVDLRVEPGELVTLLGPSGSGKTTLLNVVAGFEAPSAGEVILRGREISRMSPAQREVGMVFQHYALFPHMTVAANVGYGLRARRRPRAERERRVAAMLDSLRLSGYGERYPRQLSGGQQQRVALGRALAYDPQIVLMDEPLGALDPALRTEMAAEIRRLRRDLGATMLYVTHDRREALALSDRVAILHAGRIVATGTPEELYERPRTAFVASFLADANLLAVESYELLAEGARVRCAGQVLECPAPGRPSGPAVLAVRRRGLRAAAPPPALRLAGTVAEALLLGDDREVTVDVPAVGRVTASLDARESAHVEPGAPLDLFAAADEAVLVAADARPSSPSPSRAGSHQAGDEALL